MSAEENKVLVHRLFDELFNHGDGTITEGIIAPDYVDHSPIPAPGPGPGGFAQRAAALRAAFVREADFGVFVAEDDLVAFTWTFTGVHAGPFAGVPPTGKQVSLAGINVERLLDGRIVEHWSQFDLAGLMRQLNTP